MDEPKRTVAARTASLKHSAERRSEALEQTRLVNFPVAVYRRFKKIEGSHLALVIGANAFIALIPLMIIGYAFLEAFNPDRSIGTVLVERFHLTGASAADRPGHLHHGEGGQVGRTEHRRDLAADHRHRHRRHRRHRVRPGVRDRAAGRLATSSSAGGSGSSRS